MCTPRSLCVCVCVNFKAIGKIRLSMKQSFHYFIQTNTITHTNAYGAIRKWNSIQCKRTAFSFPFIFYFSVLISPCSFFLWRNTIRLHNRIFFFCAAFFYDMCLKVSWVFILPVHLFSHSFQLAFNSFSVFDTSGLLVSFTNLAQDFHFTCNQIQFEYFNNPIAIHFSFVHFLLSLSVFCVSQLKSLYFTLFCPALFVFTFHSIIHSLRSLNLFDLLCITFNF